MDEMKFKIVSGGQTGIDQAALAEAVAAEVPYSGWIPKGRRTEAGTLDAKYTAMQEMPTDDYRKRTRQMFDENLAKYDKNIDKILRIPEKG